MRASTSTMILAFGLAACAPAAATDPAGRLSAGDVPQATARLTIQAAAPAAAAPVQPLAFLANGVTIEAATAVIAEVNLKGWEYEEDDEHEGDDGADEREEEEVEDDSASLSGALLRGQAEDDSIDEEEADEASSEDTDDSGDEEDSEDPEVENVDFKGPYHVDLLTGASTPPFGDSVLPSGAYRSVEFKLDAPEDSTTAASIEIAGRFAVDGVYHPFILRNLRDEELKWDFAAPVSMSAAAVNELVLRIPLGQWVNAALVEAMAQSVRDGAVVPDADGVYLFTTETAAVADILEANLENEGGLEHDDGDDDEEDDEAAE